LTIRIGVIGVGYLGKHHARILSALPGVQLVGVVDKNLGRVTEIASEYGTRASMDPRELMGKVDAVTIAVPTELHHEVALSFLSAGISVLVEKPMARDLDEAEGMIAAARRAGAILAVGHTERFNPAVAVAREHLTEPRFIEVHRLGVFPERSLDIDVVLDVMIHDLDVILSLVNSDVESIDGVGVPVLTKRVDIANVRVKFKNGCLANLTASRISRDRVRKIRFFQPEAYLSIDYAEQKVEKFTLSRLLGIPRIEGGSIPVTKEEPLARELADFADAVRTKRPPLVDGEQGKRALALAKAITDKIAATS
jgi:predicted dehydrogenase